MLTKTYNDISKRELVVWFFKLFNTLQADKANRLTDSQILLLAEFAILDGIQNANRFKTSSRVKVIENLLEAYDWKITKNALKVAIYAIEPKGFIIEDTDRIKYINPQIMKYINKALTSKDGFSFNFKFNLKDE
tara:strand:+ start:3266 stop:3667 length:402 start_codon:yes stop_codon:yes gene_type:complete